ncbi:MAG: hypothetical protein Kow00121_41150 [Elainellaceae cyanobacterium]
MYMGNRLIQYPGAMRVLSKTSPRVGDAYSYNVKEGKPAYDGLPLFKRKM